MIRWMPFGRKRPFLEAEAEEWQLETWQWLLLHLGPQSRRPEARVGDIAALQFSGGHALGTFGLAGNEVVITYDPAGLDNPIQLIATMAHELAHYRLAALAEEPPGGADAHEFATDLATVYMGFGLFGVSCAFNFQRYQDFMSQGWQWSRQGYLSEREWIFGLAIFLHLRLQSPKDVNPFLKPHLATDLRKARRYLQRNEALLAPLVARKM